MLKLQDFGLFLSEILVHSLAAPGKALRWTIIANPAAGGFNINRRWKKHYRALVSTLEKARNNQERKDAAPSRYSQAGNADSGDGENPGPTLKYGLIPTTGAGHAMKITKGLLEEMAGEPETFHLFITAGGDGTSLEVQQALYNASPGALSRSAILRLPMGTGNDGAEAWELENALELLIKPTTVEMNRGLKLSTATGKTWPSGEPFLAFNILSVGLDAFVTHMTNKMKGRFPGDSYKLWVDVASLLYDRLYKVDYMEVRGYDKQQEVKSFREKLLLCAMGASGHRTYGSHKMILPDDRNVCAIKQMPLLRKVALKDLFSYGGHVDKPESILFNAGRIEFTGANPILAQMDGETLLLDEADFPAVIELTDPVIPVLKMT